MNYLLTCSAWLEALAKKEIEKLWYDITSVKDRLVYFSWDLKAISRVNINSRIWNKLYLVLDEKKIENFDELYDLVYYINWKIYIKNSNPITVNATSIRHILTSIPSLQKIWKKAIVKNLVWDKMLEEDKKLSEIEVLIFLYENNWQVLLNTTWEALHKRWYRQDAWEAPIKENLASSLVLLSNWNFKSNLYDFCCWSGTILIEAWMIAKNIAPWLNRKFDFQNFEWLDKKYYEEAILEAKNKIITDKKYYIYWYDIDEEILEIAKKNAKKAWVDDIITFEKWNILDKKNEKISWALISNPPYWLRMQSFETKKIHETFNYLFEKNNGLHGWIITGFAEFDKMINQKLYKKRKLYNWNEISYFYKKI